MICLASRSPRRAQLLTQIGVPHYVHAADIDETPLLNEPAQAYVERMAQEKAQAIALQCADVVLGADTSVIIDGDILGKPADEQDAAAMLQRLSGRWHQVVSGVALAQQTADGLRCEALSVITEVQFVELNQQQIAAYIATGEPADKAGAYGIQGFGAVMVASLQGCYSNVVGLPLQQTAALLSRWQIPVWQPMATKENA
ncbi:Maf-like protein [Bacterioplanes sanyensis]|uniref:Maf family protein n=1 Tax=Bacterioplanes sanyensis TaxID=1249553 RepID=UPI001674BD24|nr:Maf family protein [Bacterioplanes sanyensis]GGY58159.1 Maf-like protein [Bacterioplanes sanyensis]